jgi:hypothetical protein
MPQLWSCGQAIGWRREAIMRWGEGKETTFWYTG